jgi:hypothetical protein
MSTKGDFDMATKSNKEKEATASADEAETSPAGDTAEIETNHHELIAKAIAEGRSLIDQGKTKIDAAMAIYRLIETLPQETIVSAFVDGATLTPKGALTYWYNCRRKLARERREQGHS